MSADDVVAIAEAVYAVPAAEFVAERKRRAADARQDGNRDLAARIAALPKASASAALANRLVHDAGDDLLRVLRLGAELREAQEAGDRERLRGLTGDRRRLLDEVVGAAADRAEQDGRRPGAAVLEELQQTLQAAMTSDAAAAAVRSGRLVRALSADGLEPADLRGAVAPEGSLPEASPLPPSADAPSADAGAGARARGRSEEAERRRRAEAEQRARQAREAADEAEQAAAAAQTESDERARAAAEAREQIEALRSRLQAAEAVSTQSERAAEAAERSAAEAAEAAERARSAADEAEESLLQ